ncbi:MAG: hypothetical protein HeimC2_00180 [Candidatus Heimdallarchaeota archaeon LC_2]|nr:MAG: hypothetical protein HeimC2_00180 [Candidatus Heimdallarchaeota archaeon LC_2]
MTNNENKLRIDKEYVVPGSLDEVWGCLADDNVSSVWQSQDCVIGNKVGEKLELFGGWVVGEILSLKPKTEISHTWKVSEWGPEIQPSIVSYQLEKIDEKNTKITLKHWDLPTIKERDSHDTGWDEQFFGPMFEFLKLTSG